ncbi:hypothetical protein [Pseudorhodoferax sp.]|uniref:hypothetical protein n=1 Tax=Pseudorhodoferax sp. TaxID=1993553 RepID=UPI002DD6A680|nr:hypothetical protein [Pseudorhodoferax sp.]
MRYFLTLAVLAFASTFAAAAVPARDAQPQQRSESAAPAAEQPQQVALFRGRWC